ncbi:MAG: hypothetical protein HYS86_01435 [Candidatus Chisholmbacteria bacterium]|nr:hypothetical protein [Candidatus Chisholmbacteria bacterium]
MNGTDSQRASYERFAELARANVSGPIGKKLVMEAQHQLIDKMRQRGLLTEEDAENLKM